MTLRIVQLGSPRSPGEGLRLGTVRRPPRGVPKSEFAKRDFYDVWLPVLSPSAELLKLGHGAENDKAWAVFLRKFRAEMKAGTASEVLDVLAALSHRTNFALGCYCAEERRCHRSVLRAELESRGAAIG